MADKRLDPFDVEALERAVNNSAARVSAICISFLIFSLYMLVAVGTVTQRQLFLNEPTKLPVLNIDLPLWWFFLLAPVLFVIFHVYVLLQVLLLGRTATAYNAAVARLELSSEENVSLRQHLANTVFAQIFAGSPREQQGFIGTLLRTMVWITLALAPILIIVAFQFRFLPYHSHIVTWLHRLLILAELAAFFLIWPLALDAARDFQWPKVSADFNHFIALPLRLISVKGKHGNEWCWPRQRAAALSACLLYIIVSLSIASFPGEPHINLFTGQSLASVQCDRRVQEKFAFADLRFDRLILPGMNLIDDEKLAKIKAATSHRKLPPWGGERTQSFSSRNFDCSDLSGADFRRMDFSGSSMVGAKLVQSDLQGALWLGPPFEVPRSTKRAYSRPRLMQPSLRVHHLFSATCKGRHSIPRNYRVRYSGGPLEGS